MTPSLWFLRSDTAGMPGDGPARGSPPSLRERAATEGARLRRAFGALSLLAFVGLAAAALVRESRILRAAETAASPAEWAGRTADASAAAQATPPEALVRPETALAAGATEPGLIVLLRLGRRQVHQTAFTLALERQGAALVPLIGHSTPDGRAGPLRLPPGLQGRFDVTLRVPGFLPARALGVTIGEGVAVIDFSAGGVAPLRAGDLDGDERIDTADAWQWLRHRNVESRRAEMDVDGDGEVALRDLRLLWTHRSAARAEAAPR